MAKPKLATSRPAALTGTVGQGGVNRPHDVALVQALLGARRDKRGRPYLKGKVTGKFDADTAAALLRYRMDNRDANIKRPLGPRGPLLNKLGQVQALAVLEGTATPYSYNPMAEAGRVRGLKAKDLSTERKIELTQVMKELTQDWGIAFDVEVKVVTANAPARTNDLLEGFESRPLVAHFTPRNLSVHNGQRLSPVMSNTVFHDRAKGLYEALSADLKARCIGAFGVKDPVDMKIQQALKDDLACIVRTDLEGVEASAQFYLADFRKRGFTLAARFLDNYLKANADPIQVSREEALSFDDVQVAVQINIRRFWQDNLIAPKSNAPGANEAVETITKNPKEKVQAFEDHWVRGIPSRAFGNWIRSKFGIQVDRQAGSIGFGPGGSNLTSTGSFFLERKEDRIIVRATVTHVWSDPGYDFNKDAPFHEESKILERHGKAKPFRWKAEWDDLLTGELEIVNAFSSNAWRRGISLEVNRLVFDISP